MIQRSSHAIDLKVHPLTPKRWLDFEKLFGGHGAYGGCWCMWWRSTRREFEERKGEGNRKALKAIVDSGNAPGILAFLGKEPVGWCSVAPREEFSSLERSPVLKRLDDQPVWSIVCFYVGKGFRGHGIAEALIGGALDYVKRNGGFIVEAYPTPPKKTPLAPASSYMGLPAMFARSGFVECARPSQSKVIMRFSI